MREKKVINGQRIYHQNLGKPVGDACGINQPENGALRGLGEERNLYRGHTARNIKSESGLLEFYRSECQQVMEADFRRHSRCDR